MDAEEVQRYKADIKAHLLRLGLIRGQPRATFLQSAPTTPSASGSQTFHYAPSNSASAGLHMFQQQAPSGVGFRYRLDDSNLEMSFPSGIPSAAGHELLNLPSSSSASFSDTSALGPDMFDPSVFSLSSSSSPASSQDHRNVSAIVPIDAFGVPAPQTPEIDALAPDPTIDARMQHILYYFNNVRGLQYVFSSRTATDAAWSTAIHEPQGALTSAICALSNFHFINSQRVSEYDAPREHRPVDAGAQPFHDEASLHLDNARRHQHYTHADAMAALHLISYSLAATGGAVEMRNTRWAPMLEIACDWLSQSGMLVDENPKMTLLNMDQAGAFSAKVTMYMDIFMSVTMQQPPRLLALYRRLLGGGASYWADSGSHRGGVGSGVVVAATDGLEVRMDELTGCTDATLLALANIAALAHWKARELNSGTLSVRDLIMRGMAIETALRERTEPSTAFVDTSQGSSEERHRVSGDFCRRLIAAIFQESAILYLNTVLSGCSPGVPEIMQSTNAIVHLLQQLPVGGHDRALLLPLCLAGSLVDAPQQREMIRSRLFRISVDSANVAQVMSVLSEAWQSNDMHGRAFDWREVMQDRGLTLLLV
ncbi:hypothetical protein EWM64_g3879 [Hericium alpestre]|uniref:Uncharacterized protein n=1 Tax=Hericium alpestre TaxID=135208 RepID=A0A4Z0A083_9AGAM|nr:hypothetical protein EWM64_g3879 [Hericium alpestre]